LLVFAGGAQIAAVGIVLAGGSPVAAVVAGAVLNTRMFPYGFAIADVIGPAAPEFPAAGPSAPEHEATKDEATKDEASKHEVLRHEAPKHGASKHEAAGRGAVATARRWLIRALGTHVITDESVAFALRQSTPGRRRSAFWTCGVALFVVWNLSVLLGIGLGSVVRDTNAFGLDATFPAVMLALALPTLTSRRTRLAAGTGAVIAVALTPVLPAGLPLLAALGGLGTQWTGRRTGTGRRGLGFLGGWGRGGGQRPPRDGEAATDSRELSAEGKR
jgi:predicted branched-subunit amino acid permease